MHDAEDLVYVFLGEGLGLLRGQDNVVLLLEKRIHFIQISFHHIVAHIVSTFSVIEFGTCKAGRSNPRQPGAARSRGRIRVKTRFP